jgi:putative ABC transport system permease protein
VAWAVPLFKSNVTIRTGNGELEASLLLGVDDTTLIGLPPQVLMGNIDELRRPDAVAVSEEGFKKVWRNQPVTLGKVAELNDRRAVVVAIVKDSPKFTSSITFFTRYSQALKYTNNGRNQMSFIVAKAAMDQTPEQVSENIKARTGLQAMSSPAFRWKAIQYVIQNTGIPISIGTVVALGILVGIAVVGLMFNLFVLENLKQFAVLKAIGTSNLRLIGMVFLQAAVVGFVGFSVGLFGATMFFETAGKSPTFQGFFLPWYVAAGSGAVAAAIIVLAALFAMRRVLFVDPAIVFRG